MEPTVVAVASDDEGVVVDDLKKAKVGSGADKARFLVRAAQLPEPTGRTMSGAPRQLVACRRAEPAAGGRQPLRRPVVDTRRPHR